MKTLLDRVRKNEFLRNVFTLVSATGLAQAIALMVYPVLTRIYTPEEHGLFSLYLSIVTITGIMATGKYELAIMLPKREKDGIGLTVLSVFISLIFSALLLLFIAIFHRSIPGWLGNLDIGKWLYFIPLSTFLVAVFQSLGVWYNRQKDYRVIAGSNLGQSVFNSAVKLSTSTMLDKGGGLVVGSIAGQLLGAAMFIVKLGRAGLGRFKEVTYQGMRQLSGEYAYFPRFSMPHKLINNLSGSLPVFAISLYFSAEQVGFFGLGFMLIHRPMNLISNSFTKVFSQKIIKMHNDGQAIYGEVRRFVLRMCAVAVLPFLAVMVFSPWLVSLIFGKEWLEAGEYMQIFVPWLFVVFLTMPLIFLGDMLSRQKKALGIEIVKLVLRVLSLGVGIYLDHIIIALLLFSGVSFLVMVYSLFWYLGIAKKADLDG
jgi:O-antigen/teichoic acid export membrane protein